LFRGMADSEELLNRIKDARRKTFDNRSSVPLGSVIHKSVDILRKLIQSDAEPEDCNNDR
ncbi:hypothetical protein PENTCL1PPCAC_12508, partial [Pristionchus entomophagus]